MLKTIFSHATGGFHGLIVGLMFLLCSMTANASIEYNFNTPFIGDVAPNPSTPAGQPWVQAFFTDVGPPNSGIVYLTVTNVALTPGEFIQGSGNGSSGGLFFNLNTNLNVLNLNFSLISSNGNFGPIIKTGEDSFHADGDGIYNIQFDFSTQNFSVDSSFTYELTLTGGDLTASDFEQLGIPGPGGNQGPYYAAAKIMGDSGAPGGSTYIQPGSYEVITVPEPTSFALLATGIGIFFARTRLQRRT